MKNSALLFFVLLFFSPFVFGVSSTNFSITPIAPIGGGQVDSNNFNNWVATEQGIIGTVSSTNFVNELGIIYSDGIAPTIISFSPNLDTTTVEASPTFRIIAEDTSSGLNICNAKGYRNNILIFDENYLPSHGVYGECQVSVPLPNEFDYAVVKWVVYDNFFNASAQVSSAQFVKSSHAVTPPVGGAGGAGSYCRSFLQCVSGLYCFSGVCSVKNIFVNQDLNDLVVLPEVIDLGLTSDDSSEGSSFSLRVDLENIGSRVLPITAFFDCVNPERECASAWCELKEEDKRFNLGSKEKRVVYFDCNVSKGVVVDEVYGTHLVFRTPSFAEKSLSMRIPIKYPKGSYTVEAEELPVSFSFLAPLISLDFSGTYPLIKTFFSLTLFCFWGTCFSIIDLLLLALIVLNIGFALKKKKLGTLLVIALLLVLALKTLLLAF